MWLHTISVLMLIAVVCAHEDIANAKHEHEHEHAQTHSDKCSLKKLHVIITKTDGESCSETISINQMDGKKKVKVCDDVDISCDRGIVSLIRISSQDTQYVVSGCHSATVTFDKDQDCSTCRTLKPKVA